MPRAAFFTGCAALLLAGCAATSETVELKPTETVTTPATVAADPEPVRDTRADLRSTVAAAGDIMLGTDFPENRLADDDGARLAKPRA